MYGQVEFMKTVVGKLKDVLSSSKLIDTDKTKLPTFVNSQDEIEVVKNSVFVIMAMGDPENDKEYEIIKSECKKLGLNSTRVDELAGSYSITEDIIIKIIESEFIIADLTYDRPNVYYELGFAHGIGHEGGNVLLIAKKGTEPHFDLAHLRIQYYESFEDLHTIVYDQMEKLKDERDKVPND